MWLWLALKIWPPNNQMSFLRGILSIFSTWLTQCSASCRTTWILEGGAARIGDCSLYCLLLIANVKEPLGQGSSRLAEAPWASTHTPWVQQRPPPRAEVGTPQCPGLRDGVQSQRVEVKSCPETSQARFKGWDEPHDIAPKKSHRLAARPGSSSPPTGPPGKPPGAWRAGSCNSSLCLNDLDWEDAEVGTKADHS